MCDYCNRIDGGHFRGCPMEPEDDERPDTHPFKRDAMDAAKEELLFNWDDDRWNK